MVMSLPKILSCFGIILTVTVISGSKSKASVYPDAPQATEVAQESIHETRKAGPANPRFVPRQLIRKCKPVKWIVGLEVHRLPSDHWKRLTSNRECAQEMSVLPGVKFRKTAPMEFSLSNIITVLHQDGEIFFQQEGIEGDPESLFDSFKTVLKAWTCKSLNHQL